MQRPNKQIVINLDVSLHKQIEAIRVKIAAVKAENDKLRKAAEDAKAAVDIAAAERKRKFQAYETAKEREKPAEDKAEKTETNEAKAALVTVRKATLEAFNQLREAQNKEDEKKKEAKAAAEKAENPKVILLVGSSKGSVDRVIPAGSGISDDAIKALVADYDHEIAPASDKIDSYYAPNNKYIQDPTFTRAEITKTKPETFTSTLARVLTGVGVFGAAGLTFGGIVLFGLSLATAGIAAAVVFGVAVVVTGIIYAVKVSNEKAEIAQNQEAIEKGRNEIVVAEIDNLLDKLTEEKVEQKSVLNSQDVEFFKFIKTQPLDSIGKDDLERLRKIQHNLTEGYAKYKAKELAANLDYLLPDKNHPFRNDFETLVARKTKENNGFIQENGCFEAQAKTKAVYKKLNEFLKLLVYIKGDFDADITLTPPNVKYYFHEYDKNEVKKFVGIENEKKANGQRGNAIEFKNEPKNYGISGSSTLYLPYVEDSGAQNTSVKEDNGVKAVITPQ